MSEASRAAVSGDATALAEMSASELAAADEASGNNPLIWAADAGHLVRDTTNLFFALCMFDWDVLWTGCRSIASK